MLPTNLLSELTKLPQEGIIAFINAYDKKVYLTQGTNLPMLIAKNMSELRLGTHKLDSLIEDFSTDRLELSVVETQEDRTSRLLHMKYWSDYFKGLGYSMYYETNYLAYTPRISIARIHPTDSKRNEVYVTLVNTRNEQTLVGVFETVREGKEFIETYYSDITNRYRYPVLATNQRTRELLSETKNR